MGTWRDRARPIIERVIAAHQGDPVRVVRRALRDAYPFGPRAYHPYKIWLDEIRRQLRVGRHAPPPDMGTDGLPLFDAAERGT